MYEEEAAPAALRGVARCVWRSVSEGPKRIVPDGCVDLVVGDGAAFVAGPDTAAWSSQSSGELTGVRFVPGRAAAVLGVAADELRDRRVPLGELWGRSVAERLAEGVLSPVEAVAGRMGEVPPEDLAVAELIARLEAGVARVGDAAAGLVRSGAVGRGGRSGEEAGGCLVPGVRLGHAGSEAARAGAGSANIAGAPLGRPGDEAAPAGTGDGGRTNVAESPLGRAGGGAAQVGTGSANIAGHPFGRARGEAAQAGAGSENRMNSTGAAFGRASAKSRTTLAGAPLRPPGDEAAQAETGGEGRPNVANSPLGRAGGAAAPTPSPAPSAAAVGGAGATRAEVLATRVEDTGLLSERRLRRRFVQAVGYGPATYLRISRFRRAVALAPHVRDLAALAAAAGYADQAHLSRECRALTGLTPRGYFR